jgi:hypothetical protein
VTQAPAAASPLYEKLGVPARYQVELTPGTDKLEITVDADVILPNVDAIRRSGSKRATLHRTRLPSFSMRFAAIR